MTNQNPDGSPTPDGLEEFFRAIEPTVSDAEDYLRVARGTIADIRRDGDFLAVVKMHATIEPLLGDALEQSVTRALKHPKVNFPGGDALADFVAGANLESKIRLALKSEIISDDNAGFIRALARIRNYYAHDVSNMQKNIYDAASDVDKQGNGLSILRDLMSYSTGTKRKITSRLALVYLKPFMFLRFASLLANLLHGIRPPPALSHVMGGLLADGGDSEASD
ncbi:hypothetical protein [Bradyrhizobium vignae]|uniref:Uncharacterized protein n=1 Tax=Bradyrhizobium vignae TaxID=1549949 RepID=A0A2U3PUG0_9BRAD|nr:hypothetical protein [Bradyrhizobium vignae]SPP92748.1 protein of unknown function [Bradyrhizobium vignae]